MLFYVRILKWGLPFWFVWYIKLLQKQTISIFANFYINNLHGATAF